MERQWEMPDMRATRSHTYRSGDYEITETEHYDVYRSGAVAFEKKPVDASSKMPVIIWTLSSLMTIRN